jgi:hypothetical protein
MRGQVGRAGVGHIFTCMHSSSQSPVVGHCEDRRGRLSCCLAFDLKTEAHLWFRASLTYCALMRHCKVSCHEHGLQELSRAVNNVNIRIANMQI